MSRKASAKRKAEGLDGGFAGAMAAPLLAGELLGRDSLRHFALLRLHEGGEGEHRAKGDGAERSEDGEEANQAGQGGRTLWIATISTMAGPGKQ